MGAIASHITILAIVYSAVWLGTDQRKHQSSVSLAFLRGIHRRPVNSPHKGPVTRKMLPFDDVIMLAKEERSVKAAGKISVLNTLRPRQNGRRFADDTFKRIFLKENIRISIKISLKFVPKGPINNNPALVQIMAWCRSGDKPLSEPIMVSLMTHFCVTRPQWVNTLRSRQYGRLLQTTFSYGFSWMRIYKFLLKLHWYLLPSVQLTMFYHWFSSWLGAVQATSHHLNQWWLVYWRIYASLGLSVRQDFKQYNHRKI